MRRLVSVTTFLIASGLVVAWAQVQERQPPPLGSELARVLGELPRPGNVEDVLSCAGANEVYWTTAMKHDPRDPGAHVAKRKAGWYTAVALWVFQVDSAAVFDAIKTASKPDRAVVVALATKCRPAPDNWRE